MESGEGIERKCAINDISAKSKRWNPVKELKDVFAVKDGREVSQWNPVKELKGQCGDVEEDEYFVEWNPVKELKGATQPLFGVHHL